VQVKPLCRRLRDQCDILASLFYALDPGANKLRASAVQLVSWMRCKHIEIQLISTERLVEVFALFGCELVVVVKGSCDVQVFVGAIGFGSMSFR
jgi:hypothetical protein